MSWDWTWLLVADAALLVVITGAVVGYAVRDLWRRGEGGGAARP